MGPEGTHGGSLENQQEKISSDDLSDDPLEDPSASPSSAAAPDGAGGTAPPFGLEVQNKPARKARGGRTSDVGKPAAAGKRKASAKATAPSNAGPKGSGNGTRKPRKASESPKPRKVEPVTHPATTAIRDHYDAELKRTRNVAAKFKSWGRAMRSFSDLAELVGEDEAKRVITNALSNAWCNRIQPWELVDDANKHRGTKPSPTTNGRGRYEPQGKTAQDLADVERGIAELQAARAKQAQPMGQA